MARVKGRWVFVPAPKWESNPEFYSMHRSLIVCELFHRDLRPDLYEYCKVNLVLPPQPSRMRKWRLEKWIEEHRTAAAAVVTFAELTPLPGQGRGAGERARKKERREFFRDLARLPAGATL